MKKILNLIFATTLAALAVYSCGPKEEPYKPGTPDPEGCYGVFFPTQDASGSHTYDPEMERNVSITVSRTNTSGAITVPFTTSVSDEGVFKFGTIQFADGQSETELLVEFPNIEEGKTCSFSVQLEDDNAYVSHYGSGAIALDFSVIVVKWEYILNPKTKEKCVFEFTQGYWSELCYAYVKYYLVNDIMHCQTECTGKHIYNGEEYESFEFWGTDGYPGQLEFNIYTKELNKDGNMFMELIPSGIYFHTTYEAVVYLFDFYYYWTKYQDSVGNSQGIDLSWIEFAKKYESNYPVGYYDGNGGLFFFAKGRYMYEIGGWSMETYDVIGIGEGFTRTDYSLALETDFSEEGVTPVFVETGADVEYLQYAVYEGELNSAQTESAFEAILSGKADVEKFSDLELDEEAAKKYGTIGVAPEKTGVFTVLAVAYAGDNSAQNQAAIVVNHVAAGDVEDLAVNISVFTEPTPARYKSYTEYDSFAYGVAGSDITEAHIAVVPASKLDASALAAVKYNTAAVPAEVIESINGEGGYYDVVSGLSPGTAYAVVVWATNGSLDATIYDIFETTPSPEVWETVGSVTWTDSFFGTWFGNDPVSYDVELQASQDVEGRYRLVNLYGEAFPYNDPGDWDDSKDYYLVINADDPDYVWFETFDTGCSWGYGNFILASDAGLYVDNGYSIDVVKANAEAAGIIFGKMEGNVITFPVDGILKAMANYNNGGWYYGNHAEPYTITLNFNESGSKSSVKKSAAKTIVSNGLRAAQNKLAPVKFEREPKPVQVKIVKLDNVRKSSSRMNGRNLSESLR